MSARATTTSGRLGLSGMDSGLPKIRLMHAGKYTAEAPSRGVPGSFLGAEPGISGSQRGIRSGLATARPASVTPLINPSPVTDPTPWAVRSAMRPARCMSR